jgi:hypothetical protein
VFSEQSPACILEFCFHSIFLSAMLHCRAKSHRVSCQTSPNHEAFNWLQP